METKNQNNKDEQLKVVYRSMNVQWDKPKEAYKKNIDAIILGDKKRIGSGRIWMGAVAAMAVVLLSLAFWIRFSSTEVIIPKGERKMVALPDGSNVTLNAESTIRYHNRYWKIKRIVTLDGEAFFDVKKGKPFMVRSKNGVTKVLGTSFNIYNRKEQYRVTCTTGCVSVKVDGSNAVQLNPGQKIESDSKGFEMLEDVDLKDEMAWRENDFAFSSDNLSEVFNEIERHFDVVITFNSEQERKYSGRFPGENVNNVLALVCKPFGFTFTEVKQNEFIIEEGR